MDDDNDKMLEAENKKQRAAIDAWWLWDRGKKLDPPPGEEEGDEIGN